MFPSVPRRRTALALLATAAAIPAFAASADATVGPVSGTTAIPVGQVTLETIPFGFGVPSDGISTASFDFGTSKFTWYNGKVGSHVTGTLHVEGGQNARFRVRVDGLTGNNEVLDTVDDKDNGTAVKTSSTDIPVDVTLPSEPNLLKARITLEEQSTTDRWKNRGDYYTQVVPRHDNVTILGRHMDLGGSQWDNGAPLTPAVVSWAVGEDGTLTATYRGYTHFQGFSGSGRVELRAIEPIGLVGTYADGPTHSSNGAGHDVSPQDTVSVTSSSASTVEVVMQSWVSVPGEAGGGHWDDLGSQAVSAGE